MKPIHSIYKIFLPRHKVTSLMAVILTMGIRSASATDYPTTVLADNPVAYYRLEEANGSDTVADSSPNDFTGFVTYSPQADNVTIFPQLGIPGIDTNAALFATSTGIMQGNIDVPVNSTINPVLPDGITGAPFSVELWVQSSLQPGNFEVPLDDSSDFGQPPPFNNSAGWNIYETASPATWSYSMRPSPGYVGSGPAVVVGQWAHLVLTYDGTNATFYVNGVVGIAPIAIPQFLANNGAEDLKFGEGPATGFAAYDGAIDEVAIYNYPLSAIQVANHYAVGTNSIRPSSVAPSFLTQPAPTVSGYAGVPVTLTSQAGGTAPLAYQWSRQGTGAISGATNNNYTFTPVYPGDNGASFFVTVTNSVGHTNSSLATLTVLTNLNLDYSPFSITRRAGGYAAFRTVADGALPITYQWHSVSNSVDTTIVGATSDTLWLSNVQASVSGISYYARIASSFGTVTSGQATLTVVPAVPGPGPVTAYSKVVAADSPVGYWRLDETNGSTVVADSAGSFDGAYSFSGADLTFGYPTGIPKDIDTGIHVTNTAIVTIPYALELNPVSGPWSYEFWIQPTSLDSQNFHTPISSVDNRFMGAHRFGWNVYQHAAGVWTWNLFSGGNDSGSFSSEFTDNPIVPGTWYHMVLTDDGTNMNWYSNDRLVLTLNAKSLGFVQNGTNGDPGVAGGPITLAVRSDGVFGDWDGGIEDVAVYNYVLQPQQIRNHFLNTTHLTAVTSGPKIVLTWPVGTLQSAAFPQGPYSDVGGATSPYTNSAAGPNTFYRVHIAQ